MAKQSGIIKLKGNLGGINFFKRNGESFAREETSINKSRIMSDPSYKRTRENMSEFSGSAAAAKSLRRGFASVNKIFADKNQYNRFLSILKGILNLGAGVRGRRNVEVVTYKSLLEGVPFNSLLSLDAVLQAPFTLASTAARDEATLTIPDFDTDAYLQVPAGATHFRIVCALATLSDHVFNSQTMKYEASDPDENALGQVIRSAEIPVGGMVGNIITLNPVLAGQPVIPASVALLAAVGVEFLQEINGGYYLLSDGNAMDIVKVF